MANTRKNRNSSTRKASKRIKIVPLAKKKAVPTAVKTYVKKQIHGQIENKSIQLQFTSSLYGVNGSPTLNAVPLSPYSGFLAITQGVGPNARTGNIIKTRRLMFRYVLRPLSYDAVINTIPQPYEIQMIFCRVKSDPTSVPVSAEVNQLFQLNNSALGPQGTLEDLCMPFNTDYFQVFKVVRHKLGYADNVGTGQQANAQYFANNDFKMNVVRSINLTKYMPKTVKFNDNSATPTSKGVFLMINVIPAGQSSAIGATQLPVRIHSYLDYQYEDA